MKIGLIVYSYTGNTLFVAEKIRAALEQRGHTAVIERITAANENPNIKQVIRLLDSPDPAPYDRLLVATPVNGFQAAAVFQEYLKTLPNLTGRTVDVLITHFFPFSWMGGTQTLRQVITALTDHGATIGHTGVINWSNNRRERDIAALVEEFGAL